MRSSEIRRRFLDYFIAQGHREVPSSSLVPHNDPTLLFTNAGMVQFKSVFLGGDKRDYVRATTCQKCVRAGGKHNDLENVGHTDRHHTFFEMLGNFSFGDYFKKEAIAFAWELVTSKKYYGIDPDRIRISVHHKDDDARQLWKSVAGVRDGRIYGLSDKDNFWQMADTGPCGPCSEIYVDLRGTGPGGPRADLPPYGKRQETLDEFYELAEAGEFVEIWNLVFMQYDRQQDGTLVPLPAPSVDTGEGLERTTAVLQDVRSNYHTDLFTLLIERAEKVIGRSYEGMRREGDRIIESATLTPADVSFRVLADHARAVAFLLADGVYPSNEGRGYVLRRILRRAVRHAYLLGRRKPTLFELVDEVTKDMDSAYPELSQRRSHLRDVTHTEEERFLETIEGGLNRMAELKSVSGEEAFKLYDTYGFPIDLTQIVAAERGIAVDVPGFEARLKEQSDRSRAARKAAGPAVHTGKAGDWIDVKAKGKQEFVGYNATKASTAILAFQQEGGRLGLVLKDNPFYAESGGQVSDTGDVVGASWALPVDDVKKVEGRTAIFGPFEGPFEPTEVEAAVNERRRRDIERNHTATHLVHAALRKVLGTHVHQAGSVVAPDRLRFDFHHHHPVSPEQLEVIEREVNQHVWDNLDVLTDEMKYDEAIKLGAMAFFTEKYGDVVRVVKVPDISIELCGGTHVRTTGQIGFLKFAGESGVGAGLRRIEALTGPGAFGWFAAQQRMLQEAAAKLGSTPEHLAKRVEALTEERKKLEKRVEELIKGGGAAAGAKVTEENGTAIAVSSTPSADRNEIGAMVDAFRNKTKSGVHVIFATGERPGIHVGVTDDLVARGVTAPVVVNKIAALTGGKGGGRPHFASAGAGPSGSLASAEAQAPAIVRELLAAHA